MKYSHLCYTRSIHPFYHKTLFELNLITFILNALPLGSVKLKALPPINDLKIFEVTSPACGFLVFATTSAKIIGLAKLNPGLMKLFYIF